MPALSVGIDIAKASFTAALWQDGTGQPLGTKPRQYILALPRFW